MARISPLTQKCRMWRAALIAKLQARGDWCGHGGPHHLDCKEPRGAWHHITGSLMRIKFYEQQAAAGNLQVLCIPCHQNKSRQEAKERKHARLAQHDAHVREWALRRMNELVMNYRNGLQA